MAALAGVAPAGDAPLAAPLGVDPEVEGLLAARRPALVAEGDRLVVCWADRPGLFARVAGVLALRSAQILAASASSSDGWAVEVFRVRTPSGEVPHWESILVDLREALNSRLAVRAQLAERAQAEPPRAWPGTMSEPTVTLDEGTGVTVIEVAAADRVGLAFSLASALAEMDCTIVKATLSTLGPNAVDTFSVGEPTGGPLADPQRAAAVRRALLYAAVA